jgi:hypothetical protein
MSVLPAMVAAQQLSTAIDSLKGIQGLEKLGPAFAEVQAKVGETHDLVNALVGDCQRLADNQTVLYGLVRNLYETQGVDDATFALIEKGYREALVKDKSAEDA